MDVPPYPSNLAALTATALIYAKGNATLAIQYLDTLPQDTSTIHAKHAIRRAVDALANTLAG